MPIRDLLQAQIEQVGQAIGKMISKFLGLKNDGKIEEALSVTQTALREELSLDVEELCRSEKGKFSQFFEGKPYSVESFELLSTYFAEAGKHKITTQPSDAKLILGKAIILLELADQKEQAVSMARMFRKTELQTILNQLPEE